jgi:hypothetical protein
MAGANKIMRSLHLSQSQIFYMAAEFSSLGSRANNKITERQQDSKEIADECKEKILDAMTTKFVNFEIGGY